MYDLEVSPGGVILPQRVKLIVPNSLWHPTKTGLEVAWGNLDKDVRKFLANTN